jgi:serine/threonine-protein kinase
VDTRTDVWALGCILYELFTGKPAFPGEDITEIIATVVKGEPDWAALPETAPTNIRFVLGRCLEKDMNRRFRAVADVGIEIEEALTSPIHPGTTIPAAKGLRRAIPLGLAALLAVSVAIAAATVVWYMKPAALPDEAVTRLTVALDQETQLTNLSYPLLALSPDGTQLAYVAIPKQGGVRKLYVRALNSLEARPIPGTEGAQTPFFSPDGQWIGFFAQGKLRKVSVAGGAAQSLCDAPTGLGGAWGPDGTIFFAPFNTSGLFRVSAAGGEPQEVTTLKRSEGEISHRWPQVLPGGKAVLFTVWTGPGWEERHVAVQSLETGERKILVRGGTTGRYLPTGHLVFTQGRTLMAMPFDLAGLEVTGDPPVPLAEQVMEIEGAQYTFSASGLLAYLPDNPRWQERRLVWVDREGSIEPLAAPPRPYVYGPRISPDGRQVAVHIEGASWGIWVYDFARATLTRLTSGEASQFPVWTPDGKRIAYRGTRTGFRNLFWMAADGTEVEERLTTSEHFQTPSSWSPDGKWLAFQELTPNTGSDIWVLPLEEGGEPKVFLSTSASEVRPRFSPDGRWLAYQSNESGRDEVYVRPFPGPGGKWQISTEGGGLPFWARNGRELFYINDNKVMAVEITPGSGLTAGVPRLLFERNELLGGYTSRADVSLDGQRFLMIQPAESADVATQINVVLNWFEELKRLVPTGE